MAVRLLHVGWQEEAELQRLPRDDAQPQPATALDDPDHGPAGLRSAGPSPFAVLRELEASGLDLDRIGGNPAKLRLALDLAARLGDRGRVRVLDVGCAGPTPLNLWEPFTPLADRLELVGIDVLGVDRARERASQLGLRGEFLEGDALELERRFGGDAFDAVVSSQVLEHVRDWGAAVQQMARVVRPGGLVLLTCDSGDLRRGAVLEARLAGKRRLARLRERIPVVSRVTDRLASGEWERGIEQLGLEAELRRVGLEVVASAHYSIAALKEGQRRAGWRSSASARQLWLALEEAFGPEREGFDPRMFANLYVHARRPA